MSKRVLAAEAEYLEAVDYERFGSFPQAALDDVVADAIGWPAHWAAFTVAKKSAQEVTVSPGRYYADEVVYEADAIQTLNLTSRLPLAASDEKYVALILRGDVEDLREDRSFDTSQDPETEELVDIPTAVVRARTVRIVVQEGEATPAPARLPVVAETDACIAYVRLTIEGVQDIIPGERFRVKSVFEIEGRVTALEGSFEQITARTVTLETGMANANNAIAEIRRGLIRPEIFREVRRDVAAMRRQLDVPEGARSAYYDPALVLDFWDTTHPAWLARIDEGIQMSFSTINQQRLELNTTTGGEADPRIRMSGRRMTPAFTEVKRIFNEGGRATRLISQLTHVEIEAILRTVSRTRTVYGPTVNVCENSAEWSRYNDLLESGRTFAKDGETFVATKVGEQTGQDNTHTVFAVRSVKQVGYSENYWDYQSRTLGLNGSTYGQTFLVDQPLICPSIELEFAKIGTDGAVYVLFCKTDETGAPLVGEIVASAKIEHADLALGWNKFVPDLTIFEPGHRYAWYAVTTGNHQLYGSEDNAFTGGTSFRFTDGIWAQGDLTFDFNFRVNGCRFKNTRTVIEFKSMTLTEGMTQFELLYPNWEPEGTAIAWEFQPVFGGQNVPWSKLTPAVGADSPLAGLPGQVNLRCTLLATPDLAPMIELSADAVSKTARVRDQFRAVSKALALGLTTTSVETLTVVDDFDPALHAFSPRILAGASNALIAPDTTTVVVDADKPSRRAFLSTYTVPAGTSVLRTAPGGTTSNLVVPFFGQNTAIFAL